MKRRKPLKTKPQLDGYSMLNEISAIIEAMNAGYTTEKMAQIVKRAISAFLTISLLLFAFAGCETPAVIEEPVVPEAATEPIVVSGLSGLTLTPSPRAAEIFAKWDKSENATGYIIEATEIGRIMPAVPVEDQNFEAPVDDENGIILHNSGYALDWPPFSKEVAGLMCYVNTLWWGVTYEITVTPVYRASGEPDVFGESMTLTAETILPDVVSPVLTATALSQTDIGLTWEPSENATGYYIVYSYAGDNVWDILYGAGEEETEYIHTSLEPDTTVLYRITAVYYEFTAKPSDIVSATSKAKSSGGGGSGGGGGGTGGGSNLAPPNAGQIIGVAYFCKCGIRFGSADAAMNHIGDMQQAWLGQYGQGTDPAHSNWGSVEIVVGYTDSWSDYDLWRKLGSLYGWF